MNPSDFTGLFLWEARNVLEREGITHYDIVVTGPPRLQDRNFNDDFRVVTVNSKKTPIQIIVCREEGY